MSETGLVGAILLLYRLAPLVTATIGSLTKLYAALPTWNKVVLGTVTSFSDAKTSWREVEALLSKSRDEIIEADSPKHSISIGGNQFINLNNETVNFKDFSLESGTSIQVQGDSGVGKTSLCHAIHDLVNQGCNPLNLELEDGISDRLVELNCVYTPPSATLVDASITETIVLRSATNIDASRLKNALDASCFSDTMEKLDLSLTTQIGIDGGSLSAGEQARLAIARSLYWCRGVLILDECLSHLDNESANTIIQNIKNDYPHLSLVLISHGNNYEVDDIVFLSRQQ